MIEIRQTRAFDTWITGLRDKRNRARIAARIQRLSDGNFGDAKPVGGAISELRLHHGPGYRVYFTMQGSTIVILLCGGDKGSQKKDIETAKALAADLEDQS